MHYYVPATPTNHVLAWRLSMRSSRGLYHMWKAKGIRIFPLHMIESIALNGPMCVRHMLTGYCANSLYSTAMCKFGMQIDQCTDSTMASRLCAIITRLNIPMHQMNLLSGPENHVQRRQFPSTEESIVSDTCQALALLVMKVAGQSFALGALLGASSWSIFSSSNSSSSPSGSGDANHATSAAFTSVKAFGCHCTHETTVTSESRGPGNQVRSRQSALVHTGKELLPHL